MAAWKEKEVEEEEKEMCGRFGRAGRVSWGILERTCVGVGVCVSMGVLACGGMEESKCRGRLGRRRVALFISPFHRKAPTSAKTLNAITVCKRPDDLVPSKLTKTRSRTVIT